MVRTDKLKALSTLLILLITGTVFGQQKKEDIKAIKEMCGCYQVDFKYAETFPYDTNYERRENYNSKAPAEWIFVAEETPNKIVIQHILVMGSDRIIKHWRQDWLYENNELYEFEKGKNWNYRKADKRDVKGTWTQKVYQVDDSPRYEGFAEWIHAPAGSYWENTSDAPLPRREFTKRDDYNVMQRTNRQQLTPDGWIHEQDNLKVLRTDAGDEVLVEEKGKNIYTKIDDEACAAGRDWWQNNDAFWSLVREEWNRVFDRKENIELKSKVDDRLLYQALFALNEEMNEEAVNNPDNVKRVIRDTIAKYLVQ